MCCIPNPAGKKYGQKSPGTIQKPNKRLFENRYSGSTRTFSPTGARIWAAKRTSTTACTYDCIAILSYYAVCKAVTFFCEIEENLILPTFRKLKFVDCNKLF